MQGTITGSLDFAQVVLYVFWVFAAGLIFYLRREDKREGYPLESERSPHVRVQGFPWIPQPKTFLLPHGGTVSAPDARAGIAAGAPG
jgi:photosynthetic reaction center H subunit